MGELSARSMYPHYFPRGEEMKRRPWGSLVPHGGRLFVYRVPISPHSPHPHGNESRATSI